MNRSILKRFSKKQRFLIRLIFYVLFILLFVPALFAYKIATPPRILSPQTTPDLFDLPYHKKDWISPDEIKIKGWMIPAPESKGLFILAHGIGDSKEAYLPRAKMIFDTYTNDHLEKGMRTISVMREMLRQKAKGAFRGKPSDIDL